MFCITYFIYLTLILLENLVHVIIVFNNSMGNQLT